MSQATLGGEPFHNSKLFSSYYLTDRVSDLDAWECDEAAQDAFERLQNLWELERELVDYGLVEVVKAAEPSTSRLVRREQRRHAARPDSPDTAPLRQPSLDHTASS